MAKIYKYFVEGECEEKLINALKVPPYSLVVSGKVEVLNFINKRITDFRISTIPSKATIILIYDIDVANIDILKENLKRLKQHGFKDIKHIQSIKNFEGEILYSTNVKSINEIFNTKTIEEFKSRFINQDNLLAKLAKYDFDYKKMWTRLDTKSVFSDYAKQSDLDFIKKK